MALHRNFTILFFESRHIELVRTKAETWFLVPWIMLNISNFCSKPFQYEQSEKNAIANLGEFSIFQAWRTVAEADA